MYSRICRFFTNNNSNLPLTIGFRQKHFSTHAPVGLTEDIRKNLDDANIGCGVFVNLQKAFDIVENDIF